MHTSEKIPLLHMRVCACACAWCARVSLSICVYVRTSAPAIVHNFVYARMCVPARGFANETACKSMCVREDETAWKRVHLWEWVHLSESAQVGVLLRECKRACTSVSVSACTNLCESIHPCLYARVSTWECECVHSERCKEPIPTDNTIIEKIREFKTLKF